MIILHAKRSCSSCPFRRERTGSFPVAALERTVGENLASGHVHHCHKHLGKSPELLCVGFIRFVEASAIPNNCLQIGERLGVIDPSLIDDLAPIHERWSEMLADHARATE